MNSDISISDDAALKTDAILPISSRFFSAFEKSLPTSSSKVSELSSPASSQI